MHISAIELYKLLKGKVGEKQAKDLADSQVRNKFSDHRDTLATKKDLADLRAELKKGNADLKI